MGRLFFFFLILGIWSTTVSGAILVQNIGGAGSYSGQMGINNDIIRDNTLYAAIAGNHDNGSCDNASPASVCDNCLDNGPGALVNTCSTRRIHPDLNLEINYTASKGGNLLVYAVRSIDRSTFTTGAGGNATLVGNIPESDSRNFFGNMQEGEPVNLNFTTTWGDLCEAFFGDPTCNISQNDSRFINGIFRGELFFGLDGNNAISGVPGNGNITFFNPDPADDIIGNSDPRIFIEFRLGQQNLQGNLSFCSDPIAQSNGGLCNFNVEPGDSKAYLSDIRTDSAFNTNDFPILRVYYDEGDVTVGSSPFSDIGLLGTTNVPVGGTLNIGEGIVDGLENNIPYNFRLGLVDIAGILSSVTPRTSAGSPCFDAGISDCHSAIPSAVSGLLNKNPDCFIATATYGSISAHQVQAFRNFRNLYLHTWTGGKKIISWYYKHSPPLAHWIDQHPVAKGFARIILWPIWIMVKLILISPFLFFILFSMLFLGTLALALGFASKKNRRLAFTTNPVASLKNQSEMESIDGERLK